MVVSGALWGIVNTVLTEAVMAAAVVDGDHLGRLQLRPFAGCGRALPGGTRRACLALRRPCTWAPTMVALSVVALGLSRRHLERPGVVAAVAA